MIKPHAIIRNYFRVLLCVLFLVFSCATMIYAQSVTVSGTVVDELNEPLAGATVKVAGNGSIGTATDIDGKFRLEVPSAGSTLEISFLGYKTVRIKASDKAALDLVSLQEDATALEEVVVTGYGTFKKSAYAGSASSVKAEKFKDVPAVSFKDLLQGNATGVQFSSPSGQPGAATSINIRGMGSFNASNSPLFVIDGVPVRSGDVDGLGTKAGLDIMSTISTSDIESVNVIKDAAAASLYGSRAANGVVIITTKTGKAGKAKVTFNADWGSTDFAMQYRPVMDGPQRREYIYDGLYAGQLQKGKSEADAKAYADAQIDSYAPVPWCGYVDWDKILFKKGGHSNYETTISGGSDRYNYYSSLNYLEQDGVTNSSKLSRISGRLNVDYKAFDNLKVGANILFSKVNQEVYSEGTSYTSPFYSSRNCVVPSDPVYNEDGSWNRAFIRNSDRNPLLAATYDYNRQYITRTFNTLFAEYEVIKNLKLKSTISYDFNIVRGKDWMDPRTSNGDDYNGQMYKRYNGYEKLVWANQLSYKTRIGKDHNLDLLAGYEIDDAGSDYVSATADNFAVAEKNEVSNGTVTKSVGGSNSRQRIVSYLSRVNYDYRSKYFIGGSYRVDGSSRLHADSRWGNFWSLSGAWRIIEEDFMESTKDILSDLKLRASYGVNGTLPSDSYGYMGLSSLTSGYIEKPAIIQSQIANKDLKWETNHNMNIGLDFALWNRLNVTLEYYTRTTKNLLMDRPISMTTGFSSYLMNIGEVENRGLELEINSRNVQTKDFQWNTGFNISHNANKVVVLDGIQTEIISSQQIHKVGYPYRTFYLIEFAGINPDTGAPQFYTNTQDADGNYVKEITEKPAEANRFVTGKHAEPTIIGGFNNSLSYKWFDLSFMFSYQFGGYSYDTWAQKTEHGGNDLQASIPTYYAQSWKQPGQITQYELFMEAPSVAMNSYATTRRLHKTDFIRLKTLTFGVTVPKELTRKAKIESLRLFASANNLWTWAAYDYYDPEAVSAGTAIWGTPPLKTATVGLNISF
jgi:TonB-linked SusC/RagA family outer membrane protein